MNKQKVLKNVVKNMMIMVVMFLVACSDDMPIEQLETSSPFTNPGAYKITIKRSKKDPRNPLLTESIVTETLLKVNVLSVCPDSTVLKWSYGSTGIEGRKGDDISEDEQKGINIYEGLGLDLVVKNGEQVYITNFIEIRAELEDLFLDLYGNDSITQESEMYKRVKQMFEIKAGSSALMLENFFPEISLLFGVLEKEYIVGDKLPLDSIANPYGSGYMKILSSIDIRSDEENVIITRYDSIPQDTLHGKVLEYLNEVYGAQASSIPVDQVPKTSYVVNLEMELSASMEVQYVATAKQFSHGEGAMINVLEVIVE